MNQIPWLLSWEHIHVPFSTQGCAGQFKSYLQGQTTGTEEILSGGPESDNSWHVYQLGLSKDTRQACLLLQAGAIPLFGWCYNQHGVLHHQYLVCQMLSCFQLVFPVHVLCVPNLSSQRKQDLWTSSSMEVPFYGSHESCISPAEELLLICVSLLMLYDPPPAQSNLLLACRIGFRGALEKFILGFIKPV